MRRLSTNHKSSVHAESSLKRHQAASWGGQLGALINLTDASYVPPGSVLKEPIKRKLPVRRRHLVAAAGRTEGKLLRGKRKRRGRDGREMKVPFSVGTTVERRLNSSPQEPEGARCE
jgi:hypothetical protein